jgi:hypothetical protein
MTEFPSGVLGSVVASRTYFRRLASGLLENWKQVCDRTIPAIAILGKFTDEEKALVYDMQVQLKTLTSGRWLWVGGTDWSSKPENFAGLYNCSSSDITDWESFANVMNLAMQGCGTGAVLEDRCISQLPAIRNRLNVTVIGEIGGVEKGDRQESTAVKFHSTDEDGEDYVAAITVGDSRQGWVEAYSRLLELSSDNMQPEEFDVVVDISNIRPSGEPLKSFGGTANPAKLPNMFPRIAKILNGAIGRKLTSVECCLLIDEAAVVIVAGSIRRSAGMRQFSDWDRLGEVAKDNLWIQLPDGRWSIDPDRDALRMANHTRVFHHKPSWEDVLGSVTKQHQSGEGAIQYAPEAIARANADLLDTDTKRREFIRFYEQEPNRQAEGNTFAGLYLDKLNQEKYGWSFWESDKGKEELYDRLHRLGLNPCLAAGTLVHTIDGDRAIEDLVGETVKIFDGQQYTSVDSFRVTGENQEVYKITFDGKPCVVATPYHNFVLRDGSRKQLKDLRVGDKLQGSLHNSTIFHIESIEPCGREDKVYCCTVPTTSTFMLASGLMVGNCGEIGMRDNFCNLAEVHLNQIGPQDFADQERAFKAGALSVVALLNHNLSAIGDRYQKSRELDPIVAVCPTGIFDFFVKAFGVDWLKWWEAGRPAEWGDIADLLNSPQIEAYSPEATDLLLLLEFGYTYLSQYFKDSEENYLTEWRETVERTVKEYCDRHNLKAPNRSTAVQPSGSKSLLTGASPGYHPPKAAYMIRRITVRKNHPVAFAAIALGHTVLPSQSDKDENGVLLNDPFDPRVTEWLIEIPMKTIWADLEGADEISISKFSAIAQFDFMMQVQKHYVRHNVSSTLELRESEVEPLAKCIYDAIQNDDSYISSAILARFDDVQTYPRLPFEPIDRAKYQEIEQAIAERRSQKETTLAFKLKEAGIDTYDFDGLYKFYDQGDALAPETAACDTGLCEMKEALEQIKSEPFIAEVL